MGAVKVSVIRIWRSQRGSQKSKSKRKRRKRKVTCRIAGASDPAGAARQPSSRRPRAGAPPSQVLPPPAPTLHPQVSVWIQPTEWRHFLLGIKLLLHFRFCCFLLLLNPFFSSPPAPLLPGLLLLPPSSNVPGVSAVSSESCYSRKSSLARDFSFSSLSNFQVIVTCSCSSYCSSCSHFPFCAPVPA